MSYFKKQYIKYDEDVKTKLISVAASDMLKLLSLTGKILVLIEKYKAFLPPDIINDKELMSDLIELYEVSRDELILNDIIDIAELDEEH
tara:strand:+ start:5415 stop:5681 length:267 start_codon:yes stop_codon:yes gene_type:complete